jgi:DNA polymerase-3 subunit gamma/tau
MSENLYSKYRPHVINNLYGHEKIVKELKKRFKENSIPHAILLSGTSGTGKTTIARIIAKSIMCQNKDENGSSCNTCEICTTIDKEKLSNIYFEKNASNLGIDDMREIEESASRRVLGKYNIKIFVIDELQELSSKNKAAEKNILKILEKPSEYVYFILGTMDVSKVSTAIKNRCVHYKLNPLSFQEITKYLEFICKSENLTIDTVDKAQTLITIAQNSRGSMRTAVSYLERVIYSELWSTTDLLKELDIISDTDAIIIINHIFNGNIKALEFEINEEVLKKIKYLLMLYYKKISGVELNAWQQSQIREIVCKDETDFNLIFEALNQLSTFPYVYTDLIEFHILNVINKIKNRNIRVEQPVKPIERVRRER